MTTPGTKVVSPNPAAWRVLSYALAMFHVAYVLYVLFGALLILVWPQTLALHVAAVVWAAGTMFCDLGCPVTSWEKDALRRSGREPYPEGFLQHHVLRKRFDPSSARRNHAVLGLCAMVLNIVIYAVIFSS